MKDEIKEINLSEMLFNRDERLLDYITNLEQENERLKEWKEDLLKENIELENIRKEAIEYIKKDTRWFDSEYASVYGELCDCEGYNANRLEVMVNPTNLLNILQNGSE